MKSFSAILLIAMAILCSVASQNLDSTNPSFKTTAFSNSNNINISITRKEPNSTSIITSTQKIFQKKVSKRHAYGLKGEDSQNQEQRPENPSQQVNKTEETKNKSNEKLLKGLQNHVTEEYKTTSKKLSGTFDLASKVHVKEEQDGKIKKTVFGKLNDQVEIGKHIVDSAKEMKKQKFGKVENPEVKKYMKNNFIGPNKKIVSSETQTLSNNKNNIFSGLDKAAEENTYGTEISGQVKRNVNVPKNSDEFVKKHTEDDNSSQADVPAFIGKEVERLGHILDKTDENKHINKKTKSNGVKNMKGGNTKAEETLTPKTIENNKNPDKYMRGKAKDTVSETKRPQSVYQMMGSRQVKADGKQTNSVSDRNQGVEKNTKIENVTDLNKQIREQIS